MNPDLDNLLNPPSEAEVAYLVATLPAGPVRDVLRRLAFQRDKLSAGPRVVIASNSCPAVNGYGVACQRPAGHEGGHYAAGDWWDSP